RRMIREFGVNSQADLDAFLMERPELQGRYEDLDLTYAPVGATLALGRLMPIVWQLAGGAERVRILPASRLTAEMLKSDDIVYVGYVSGLGLLRDPVLGRSRFTVGETFDELSDRRTGRTYVTQAGTADRSSANVDYAYLAHFRGASGNRIVAVSGLRDIGVMQAAEIVGDAGSARELHQTSDGRFDLLYEVEGIGRANLSAKLVTGE